jgi:hypothetical protein
VTGLARRFSTGILDYLFGKRATASIIGADGRTRTIRVTERWLKRQEDSGALDPIDLQLVPVHILGLEGYELPSWVVGEDVEEEAWKKFRDPLTGHLTAMTLLRDGVPQTFLVAKEEWLRLKDELDAV